LGELTLQVLHFASQLLLKISGYQIQTADQWSWRQNEISRAEPLL